MSSLLHPFLTSIQENLTVTEAVLLGAAGLLAWLVRKEKPGIPAAYSVFLVFYITLLRRAPGYHENIRFYLKLWPNAAVWAGNLLNLALYVPFGWAGQRWKQSRKKSIGGAFLLSVCCEVLQYCTGRGMADVNDVLFNTLGAAVGACLTQAALQGRSKQVEP